LDTIVQDGAENSDDRVVITFDDGHISNWSLALPSLLEAKFVATFYVVTDWIDNNCDYMTSQQLRDLDAHDMLVGSHTLSHPFLPLLSAAEVRRELAESKAYLEDILGRSVDHLAFPGGHGGQRATARPVVDQ
jgi:peptidoglycan/xylan/chitin deacetylase (PgdA/CDA1 family)